MPLPERVLIDTSAFYALISTTDIFHTRASWTYRGLLDRAQEVWTTSYMLVETVALVHRRLGFEPLRSLMDVVEQAVEVFWVEHSLHTAAWNQFAGSRGTPPEFHRLDHSFSR